MPKYFRAFDRKQGYIENSVFGSVQSTKIRYIQINKKIGEITKMKSYSLIEVTKDGKERAFKVRDNNTGNEQWFNREKW